MKIILILLALGLCLADAVPGGYQPLDITEAQADATIQSYIQTGLDAVVQNAIKKGFFSNSNFALTSLTSVAEQVVNGANYKFDCNFTDSNGVVIQADFVVHQSASTNATTVTSFAYKVYYPPTITTTTTTTTTTSVPTTTVETEEESSAAVEESGETAVTESGENAEASTTESAESGENAEAAPAESGEEDSTITTTTVTGQADTETATTTTTDTATNSTETSTEASVNTTAVVSPDGFTAISADEFSQSDDLRKHFTFGFENVVQNGIISGKIPNTTFTSAKVLGASYKTLKNGEIYKFTAEADNGDGVDLELAFQVVHKVPAYSYKVTITTTIPANNTDDNSTTPVDTGAGSGSDNTTAPVDTGSDNTTTPVDNGSGSDNNTTTPVDTGAGSGSDNTTTPVDNGSGSDNNTTTPVDNGSGSETNTTTPVDNGSGSDNNSTTTPVDNGSGSDNNTTAPVDTNTTTPVADNWTVIDLAQAQQSAEIQANLIQGFNQVIQAVVDKKLLAADNYTITQLVAVSSHNLTKGVNYKFTVKANNDAQTFFLDMNFTTYYRWSNQSVKAVSYHYNYSTKAAPVQNNTTPVQNNTTPVTPVQNTTTPVQNTTTPAQNDTTPAQNNTAPAQNTTTPAQNTTTPTPNDNGYVALSATDIQAQDVQNAINYGSNQVVQLGIQKNKIPSDTYNITNVASVLKKIQPSGANYNATVTLQSAANVTVNTNFNVYWNSTSNTMILKAYSYGVTGIKKNNNGNGNGNANGNNGNGNGNNK